MVHWATVSAVGDAARPAGDQLVVRDGECNWRHQADDGPSEQQLDHDQGPSSGCPRLNDQASVGQHTTNYEPHSQTDECVHGVGQSRT